MMHRFCNTSIGWKKEACKTWNLNSGYGSTDECKVVVLLSVVSRLVPGSLLLGRVPGTAYYLVLVDTTRLLLVELLATGRYRYGTTTGSPSWV